MTIRVIVSGAAGDVGQGVMKALLNSSLDIEIYATCITPHSSWLHHRRVRGFIAPPSADVDYLSFMIRLIKSYDIDVFFPTIDGEIAKIASEKDHIERESGCLVFVDSEDKVAISDDKFATSEFLRSNGFPYPRSAIATESEARCLMKSHPGFPLVVKKRRGKGARDVYLVRNEQELEPYLGDSSFLIQEWLAPEQGEYTSGLYLGDDGEVKGVCTFRRQLKAGSTYIAERIVDPKLEGVLESIALKLGAKYLNIQSMRRGHELIPFEFNGRFSGTISMVSKVFNAPEMFIRERILGERLVRINDPARFVAMRYNEEIYASEDGVDALLERSKEI